jgi:Asp-tRNA(Asn)/Glu-tRNA(Gln) amidotransferase A subunit family amidase
MSIWLVVSLKSFPDNNDDVLGLLVQTIKNAVGMPIGVQLAGKPYHEEVVLRALVLLDKYYQANKE